MQHEDPCTNAVTNRAYYAAYHAIWAKLLELDVPVARGARYFAHKRNPDGESIVEAAERHDVLTDAELFDLETLLRLRVRADYGPDDVVEEESHTLRVWMDRAEDVGVEARLVVKLEPSSEPTRP